MLEPVTETISPEGAVQHHRTSEPAASPTTPPDLLLVERARGKEIRAFETLMQRYNQRLFRIARSIVQDDELAEAAVGEAYLTAFHDIERYEPTGKFGAWLARLAFNQALAARRVARPAEVPAAAGNGTGANGTAASSTATAEPAASAGQTGNGDSPLSRQALEQAIDGLPEVFRTVFILRAIEGISGIETAACLGLNETTVRTRLYRAQRRLKMDWTRQPPVGSRELFELTPARSERITNRVMGRLNGA